MKRIRENAKFIKRAAGTPLIAVVKDDAYGHGAERVALALSGIAEMFAVATVDEGAALRVAGVEEDILVLTPPLSKEEVLRISAYNMIAPMTSFFVLKTALAAVGEYGVDLRVHLCANTGMNRYGFLPALFGEAIKRAAPLKVEGVYSHLYLPTARERADEQVRLFEEAVRQVKAVYPAAVSHLAATGGILAGVKADMARAGLALYGYHPSGGALDGGKPAIRLYATVAHGGKTIGGGLGYGLNEENAERAHTLRIGYGDGLFRAGKLCMDATVEGGYLAPGRRKRVLKDLSAYAKENNTTEYEVLVNVTKKAEFNYDE